MQNEITEKISPDEYLFSEALWKNVLTAIFFLYIIGGGFSAVMLAGSPSISQKILGVAVGFIIGFTTVGFFSILLTISKNLSRIADSIANNN